jgi:hypothetical protein
MTVLIASLFCLVPSAFSATVVCSGTVVALSYHATGQLMLRLSDMNQPVLMCTPDTTWNVAGVYYVTPPEACKAMYATFLAARVSDLPVTNVHFDGDAVPSACNAWQPWSVAQVRHYLF